MATPNGRPIADKTIRRQLRQVLAPHAVQLAEKALARALSGDAAALQTCAELLALSMSPPPAPKAATTER
ncbi:hypothetical protein [Thauera mechernichensis]